jgi:hypothetical protein
LTEYAGAGNWILHYKGQDHPWSVETFDKLVPTSPKDYRKQTETDLNEIRVAAGVPVKQIYDRKPDVRALQSAAGVI